jgi:hypothetical protein
MQECDKLSHQDLIHLEVPTTPPYVRRPGSRHGWRVVAYLHSSFVKELDTGTGIERLITRLCL